MAMNCETFKQNIDAWLDGELSREIRQEMEKHADECETCARLLDQAASLSLMCAEMNEGLSVPLPAQAAWRKAIREEAKARRKPAGAWMHAAAGVAAALAVLVGGTFGVRMSETAPASAPTITVAETAGYELAMLPAGEFRAGEAAPAGGMALTGMHLQSDGSVQDTAGTADQAENAVETIVLRSASRSIRSASYDSDIQWLNDLVSEYGAYFEERSETAAPEDGAAGRTSSMVVRVPSDRLDDFLMELDQLGETLARSESAEDVTGRYMDTQSRQQALLAQKQKLEEMLAESKSVEELIAIDDKLTEVIASLEALEGDLRRWESQQKYSRVTLMLTEKLKAPATAEASLGDRMKTGFSDSVVWLKDFGQDALVTLVSAMPKLVVWIPALALVIAAVCLIRGRRRKG